MRKIIGFLKKILKRILPPPVHAFMREINALNNKPDEHAAELSRQIGEIG